MNLFSALARLFWNKEEKRLRMLWRLGLHTGILFVMTALFTVGLLFLTVLFDLVNGSNLQNIIAGSSPMQLQQSPWIGRVIGNLFRRAHDHFCCRKVAGPQAHSRIWHGVHQRMVG